MATVDSSLAAKCMDFCHALTSQDKSFTFSLIIGSNFTFSLDTKENKSPAAKAVRKKSPSAIRRNERRRAEFLARRSETQGTVNQVATDIIDVTLATKDGLQDGAHQVVLNSNEVPSNTTPPASSTSTPSSQPPSSRISTQASTTPTSSAPPTIATPVSSTSLSSGPTSTTNTTPSSPSDWKVVNSKQRPSRASPAPPERPTEKIDYIQCKSRTWPHASAFKCKIGVTDPYATMYCKFDWEDLHMMKFHLHQHHGIGPNPNH